MPLFAAKTVPPAPLSATAEVRTSRLTPPLPAQRWAPSAIHAWQKRYSCTRIPQTRQRAIDQMRLHTRKDLAVAPQLLGCRAAVWISRTVPARIRSPSLVLDDARYWLIMLRPRTRAYGKPSVCTEAREAARRSSDMVLVAICIGHLTTDQKVGAPMVLRCSRRAWWRRVSPVFAACCSESIGP